MHVLLYCMTWLGNCRMHTRASAIAVDPYKRRTILVRSGQWTCILLLRTLEFIHLMLDKVLAASKCAHGLAPLAGIHSAPRCGATAWQGWRLCILATPHSSQHAGSTGAVRVAHCAGVLDTGGMQPGQGTSQGCLHCGSTVSSTVTTSGIATELI